MRLPWNTEGALIFLTVLNMHFLWFRIFEELALAPKNRGWPEFTILNVFFLLFRIFEQLALALKNRGCPEIFHCIQYIFYYSGVLSNLRLPWKTELPWNFSLHWNIFYYSGFLRNLRLPWKQSLPWNLSSPGGRPPSRPPRLVRLWSLQLQSGCESTRYNCLDQT